MELRGFILLPIVPIAKHYRKHNSQRRLAKAINHKNETLYFEEISIIITLCKCFDSNYELQITRPAFSDAIQKLDNKFVKIIV